MRRRRAFARLLAIPTGVVGALIVACVAIATLAAPWLRPYDARSDRNLAERLRPPSAERPFGSDELGRDVLTRVWHGGRISLTIGVVAVAIGFGVGMALGVAAGSLGGGVDAAIGRLVDVLLALPGVLLAVAVATALGPGALSAAIAVGVTLVPSFARLTRVLVLSARSTPAVEAARALGAGPWRLLVRHVLPQGAGPLVVQVTAALGNAILSAASLGFLGLGAQPPEPEWGAMIRDGFAQFLRAPWTSLFPGAALFVTVLGLNLLGDAVRDVLDVRLV